MANGIVIVDKPQDWTSQDVVSKLRGILHEKRIGHGGTLDPLATGVLPIFVGRATRAVEFFEHADKTYIATVQLGTVTDTQDITGRVLEENDCMPAEEIVLQTVKRFVGQIEQIPPMYSAIKIGGKKLYELARAGKEIIRPPRKVTIYSLNASQIGERHWELRVHCSKGTYIRTLCHDIGQALGCGACMQTLQRVQAGSYTLAQSIPLQTLAEHPDPAALLLPTDSLFMHIPALQLTAAQEKCCRNGAAFTYPGQGRYRVYGQDGSFLAVCEMREDKLCTVKSFF